MAKFDRVIFACLNGNNMLMVSRRIDTQPSGLRRGFTIVELLIVIVVIAILAAITIVSYNGIQARAKNTARISGVEDEMKLLEAYKAINGALPTDTGCLGSNVIDTNNDGVPDCGSNADQNYNQTLINDLNTIGTQPASVTTPIVGADGISREGMFWDGTNIVWFVDGTTADCGFDNLAYSGSSGTSTWCAKTL